MSDRRQPTYLPQDMAAAHGRRGSAPSSGLEDVQDYDPRLRGPPVYYPSTLDPTARLDRGNEPGVSWVTHPDHHYPSTTEGNGSLASSPNGPPPWVSGSESHSSRQGYPQPHHPYPSAQVQAQLPISQPPISPQQIQYPYSGSNDPGPQFPASPPRPYPCDQCALSFSRLHDLKRHRDTHTGDKPYVCDGPNCGKTFTRKDALKRHQLSKRCGVNEDA